VNRWLLGIPDETMRGGGARPAPTPPERSAPFEAVLAPERCRRFELCRQLGDGFDE
jgi:hypothetical protein